MIELIVNNPITFYMTIGISYVALCLIWHEKEATEKLRDLNLDGFVLNVAIPVVIIILSAAWPFYLTRKIYRIIMGIPR